MYFVFVLGVEGSLKREILAKDPTNSFKRTWNSMNSSLEAKGKTRSLPRIQLPADTSLFPNREHKPKNIILPTTHPPSRPRLITIPTPRQSRCIVISTYQLLARPLGE